MTEQMMKDFLDGKLKGTKTSVCFGSLSCPSDSVQNNDRHPARDCPWFPICYVVRGRYKEYQHLY